MKTYEEIQDEYLKELKFKDLDHFIALNGAYQFKIFFKELASRYSLECQKELQKRIAENACNCLELYNYEYKLLEESITDEKLLVT